MRALGEVSKSVCIYPTGSCTWKKKIQTRPSRGLLQKKKRRVFCFAEERLGMRAVEEKARKRSGLVIIILAVGDGEG